MPRNALMVKPADIYGAVTREQDRQLRNALAQRTAADNERQTMAGLEHQQWQRDRLMQQDAAAQQQAAAEAEAAQRKAMQEQDRQQLQQSYAEVQRILAAPEGQRRAVASALFDDEDRAEMAQEGIDFNTLDENGIYQLAQQLEAQVGSQLGVAPADKWEPVPGTRDGGRVIRNSRTGEEKQVVAPDNSQVAPQKPVNRVRTLSAAEIETYGLPPGTVAQEDETGKINVITKRDNTGALSQKDATTAKMKLNTVSLARQQLEKIKEAFNEGRKGVNAFGGAQGLLPTQAGKKFDARVNQMRSTLTALTRVPGVGAMSDYETKLDQSKFPSRTAYESVTADTIQNLEDQLALIENGYRGLLEGGAGGEQSPQASGGANTGPVRVSSPAEAARLPAGTRFMTPDGQERVKR